MIFCRFICSMILRLMISNRVLSLNLLSSLLGEVFLLSLLSSALFSNTFSNIRQDSSALTYS